MTWTSPCVNCGVVTGGDTELPVLQVPLCGMRANVGGGFTNTPYLLVIPVNADGTARGTIQRINQITDAVEATDGMAPCCCPVFVAC